MVDRSQVVLYSGGHRGTEAEFGRQAERWGVREVTLSFEGHAMEFDKNVRVPTTNPNIGKLSTIFFTCPPGAVAMTRRSGG